MPATRPTTIQQRQKIMQLVQTGHSHAAIAQDVGVSVWTARKWVRRTRAGDLAALVSHLGRPVTGTLAASSPLVRYVALRLKRQHPTWGGGVYRSKNAGPSRVTRTTAPAPGVCLAVLATVW